MGVLTMEIEKVNKTITDNQKEVERLQRQLERKKEKKENQKQYEKDLHIATETDLKNCFCEYIEREGLNAGLTKLYLKDTRNEIIEKIGQIEFEKHFINENYERILNKVKKIYENDQKAKNTIFAYQLQQQQIKEQEQEKKDPKLMTAFNMISSILKWTCLILLGGIYLIFKFISDLAKGR